MAGSLTYTELQDYVSLQFGKNTAWETPTNYVGVWVNRAYHQLTTQNIFWATGGKRFHFPELETSSAVSTVDGTAYVAVPTDALFVRDLFDTTSKRYLRNIPYRRYIEYTDRADTTAEGEPTEWVRAGTSLYLHPTPDAVYSLTRYYRKVPTALSGGTDVTLIGSEWDLPIITLAAYIGKVLTMDYEKANFLKKEFAEQVAGIMSLSGEEEKSQENYLYVDETYRDRGY